MTYLKVDQLIHRYGDHVALRNVSFTVEAGERLCLLGPSGCGKTTTLQAIAGFIRPSSGSVSIAGSEIVGLPPEEREIGIMFQNYALFPHMSIFENVAFGLRMRKTPRAEIETRVHEVLKVVRLDHKAGRLPAQLSGGEQQRVAFARAIVIRPRLLLLDEPFSNLDARLRLTMRNELLELLEGLDIATLMVTHDQEEAMAIGDRIAVMQAGEIRQIGAPQELYRRPGGRFVGEFLGDSNLFAISGHRLEPGVARCEIAGLGVVAATTDAVAAPETRRCLLVRPERIRIVPEGSVPYENVFDGVLEHVIFLGPKVELRVRVGDHAIQVFADDLPEGAQTGGPARIAWPADASILIEDGDD